MNTLVNVARYHLVDRLAYLVLPWAILAFAFLVNLVIFTVVPTPEAGSFSGGLLSIYIFLFVAGVLCVSRSLPFGFALGLSRRSYYLGTMLLMAGLAAAYGLALTLLQAVERVTGGWGLALHFFRIPWLLDGSWYLTWITSFVLLVLMHIYGMWFGLVYRRWNVFGLVAFAAAQVLVVLAAVLITTWTEVWPEVGRFVASVSVPGLTGVIGALAGVLALGGFITMRRVTV